MDAVAVIRVARAADGRLVYRELRSSPLLTARRAWDGLYLVAGAATPIGGDDARLTIEVGDGAAAVVRSAAASVARRGPGEAPARLRVEATVGAGSLLVWAVEPTVAAGGCRFVSEVAVDMAPGGCCWWREEVVLGRDGEDPGSWLSSWRVDRAGRPVLRQQLALGAGAPGATGPAVAGGARAVGAVALLGVGSHPPAGPSGPAAPTPPPPGPAPGGGVLSVLPLATGEDVLVTALGADHPTMTGLLAVGVAHALHGRPSFAPAALLGPAGTRWPVVTPESRKCSVHVPDTSGTHAVDTVTAEPRRRA